jgi:hypothetical protein
LRRAGALEALDEAGIDTERRAETVAVEDWVRWPKR